MNIDTEAISKIVETEVAKQVYQQGLSGIVTETRHQNAPPQIVGPILENLKYIPENDV